MSDDHVQLLRSDLQEMLNKASHDGAKKVLAEIGLADEEAMKEWKDFRELMKTFKEAKTMITKTILKAAVSKVFDLFVMLVMLGVATKLGIKMGGG